MTSENKQKNSEPEHASFQHPQSQSSQPLSGGMTLESLAAQVAQLQAQINQKHPVNLNTDLIGLFQTVSAVPTQVPNTPYQQIQIYMNGTEARLYWYDANGGAWHYATATIGLAGANTYFVATGSGGATTHAVHFTDGILTS
jgi:hypothetical protein